jgi:hypothetical protein
MSFPLFVRELASAGILSGQQFHASGRARQGPTIPGATILKVVRERLTFSNVVAVIALFVALGGTAVAALDRNSVGSLQLKKNAVTNSKIRNGAVTGPKVKESTLGKVPRASVADTAEPLAYARVAFNGAVDPRYAKNILGSQVTHPSPGLYCFDLPYQPKTGQVTAEADAEPDDIASIEIAGANGSATVSDCAPNNEVEVFTFDTETSSGLQDGEFYIELNG